MDRAPIRWLIVLVAVTLLAFVINGLFGSIKLSENRGTPFIGGGYTQSNYDTVCLNDPATCNSWRFHAFVQCVTVVVFAALAWRLNDRRGPSV